MIVKWSFLSVITNKLYVIYILQKDIQWNPLSVYSLKSINIQLELGIISHFPLSIIFLGVR